MHISWARLASFYHLGVISDPLIVSKFHNFTNDPKGQENKMYTIVNGRETFYRRHTVPVTSHSCFDEITDNVRHTFESTPYFDEIIDTVRHAFESHPCLDEHTIHSKVTNGLMRS